MHQNMMRRWFLFGGSILAILVGFALGIAFMMNVIRVFDVAIRSAGGDSFQLVENLAHGIKGILAWIVFGITMTNALIIASSLSIVSMVRGNEEPAIAVQSSQASRRAA